MFLLGAHLPAAPVFPKPEKHTHACVVGLIADALGEVEDFGFARHIDQRRKLGVRWKSKCAEGASEETG